MKVVVMDPSTFSRKDDIIFEVDFLSISADHSEAILGNARVIEGDYDRILALVEAGNGKLDKRDGLTVRVPTDYFYAYDCQPVLSAGLQE